MPLELTIAILALLLTPGPTNTLVLLAGAERGMRGAMRLIPVELAGYLLTVVPLTLIGGSLAAAYPGLRTTVVLAAAVWVAVLALRLWWQPLDAQPLARPLGTPPFLPATVGARAIFVTTALNPKGLIFGLALLPSPDRLLGNLGLFAALVVLVALFWAAIGAALRRGGGDRTRLLFLMRRGAAVFLAAMSVLLVLRGFAIPQV